MDTTRNKLWGAASFALALALVGCGSGGGSDSAPLVTQTGAKLIAHDPSSGVDYVGKILLKDAAGNVITKASTTPYNPRQTCGSATCHGKPDTNGKSDWDKITLGYHFSHGRTNAAGAIQISDNFSSKPWIVSNGMYGKW